MVDETRPLFLSFSFPLSIFYKPCKICFYLYLLSHNLCWQVAYCILHCFTTFTVLNLRKVILYYLAPYLLVPFCWYWAKTSSCSFHFLSLAVVHCDCHNSSTMHTIALLLAAYICYLLNHLAIALERKKKEQFVECWYEFPLSLHIFFLLQSTPYPLFTRYMYTFFVFYDTCLLLRLFLQLVLPD